MAWISRLRALFRRNQLAQDLDEELAFHLSMREQWNVEHGMPRVEAHRDARRRFGNPLLWRERMSEIDLMILPQTILQDLRYGARTLFRNAGFTTVAILALAIGIGINTTAFTFYKAMFTRSLDARDPSRMVDLTLVRQSGDTEVDFSYPDYQAYRDNLHSFTGVIAHSVDRLILSGAGGPMRDGASGLLGRLGLLPASAIDAEFATTFEVSENYFSVLGVNALRGRTFDAMSSAELAASPSVLISENYWQKRFNGDPSILGKVVRLNGVAFTIIGVTPHDFVGTNVVTPDFWFPLSLVPLIHPDGNWLRDRENQWCRLFGRLAPGVGIGQAQAEMTAVANQVRTVHAPHSELSKPVTALVWPGSPFPRDLDSGLKLAILFLMVAVGMVLVIACANVASLQLARAASRQSELCLRLSLGASRRRLIRQLLTESALLGLIAGIIALLFTWALLKVSITMIAQGIPAQWGSLVLHVTPDLGIFAYVFAISLVAGILFGLAPALEGSRSALPSAVNAISAASPKRSRRLRDILIAAQVAVSLVLLIAGSMLIRSSIHALKMDTGYDTRHVVNLDLQFPEGPKYTADRRNALVRELRNRLAGLPEVTAITSARPPDGGGVRGAAVSLNGQKPSPHNTQANLYYTFVQPNYFAMLSIPLLSGRGFPSQSGQPEPSVILSQSAANQLWPSQNPLGRSLRLGTDGQFHFKNEALPDGPAYEVIGVARDTRGVELDGSDSQLIYLPLPEGHLQDFPILIRTKTDPTQLIDAIAPVIASLDPNLVVTASTLERMLHQTPPFLISGLAASIASIVGMLGLLLASMGIFGTVSYIVVLRTREMGIRIALGAKKRDILGLMLRESTRPVLAGLVVGMPLSIGASYLMRGILYGVNIVDGISFVGVSLLFLAIALFATYLPSRRAMRVDPVVALRYE
ncbi:MAG TPA: ABC transporter permease [Acidobacteriaceae bacterium]|jgi:predicted permease|nr:ABC transporter permease [Acidobacteriaceae bacterium]